MKYTGSAGRESCTARMLKRTLLWSVGGALAILVIMNWALAAFESKLRLYKDYDSFVWSHKIALMRKARPQIKDARVLILGDSQTMSGILPERLEGLWKNPPALNPTSSNPTASNLNVSNPNVPGRFVYNLGLPAQQPEGLLSMVRLLEAHTPHLETVIINVNAFSMFKSYVHRAFLTYYRNELLRYGPWPVLQDHRLAGKGPGAVLRQIALLMPLRRTHEVLYPFFAPGRNLTSLSLRSVRESMIKPRGKDRLERERKRAAGRKLLTGRVNEYMRRPWLPGKRMTHRRERNEITREILKKYDGYWTWQSFDAPTAAGCVRNSLASAKQAGGNLPYPSRKGAVDAWRRLFRLLRERGLRVIVVQVPLSHVWERATDSKKVLGRLDANIRRAGRGLGLEFIGRPPNWNTGDARLFHDWTHLSYCGAVQYTDWLRKRLASAQPAIEPAH